MRIALVHSFYQSGLPSGENVAVELQARVLGELGHDVCLISRHTDDYLGQFHYPVKSAFIVATGRGPSPLEAIRAFGPDIVHVHNLFPNWSSSWVRDLEIPYAITVHNFRLICPAGTLLRGGKFCDLCPASGSHHSVVHRCYRDSRFATLPLAVSINRRRLPTLLERAAAIIFLSTRSQSLFASYGLGFPDRAHVIPNFVMSLAPEAVQEGGDLKPRWLYVGRLSEEKGIHELLKHWPSNQPLDVVGSGPLEQDCRDLARGKDVQFFGQVTRDNVLEFLANAKGLLFPSMSPENSPFVYLEAISSGCPVIAKAGNAVADDVMEAQSGEVFDSFADLPAALQKIESAQEKYRGAARARLDSTYSVGSWSKAVLAVYRDIMA